MIALYVKTHRKTGLKYLGQTVADPYKYKGSGVRWLRHLIKHGNDVDTNIIRWCKDKAAITAWGIFYSDLFDVVNDPNWANLIREEGTGGWSHIGSEQQRGHQKKRNTRLQEKRKNDSIFDKKYKQSISVGLLSRSEIEIKNWKENSKLTKIANGTFGKTEQMNTKEAIENKKNKFSEIEHQQGEKNSQHGTRWVSNDRFNMKLPKDVPTPYGWNDTRKMRLPSIDKELKKLLIESVKQ